MTEPIQHRRGATGCWPQVEVVRSHGGLMTHDARIHSKPALVAGPRQLVKKEGEVRVIQVYSMYLGLIDKGLQIPGKRT